MIRGPACGMGVDSLEAELSEVKGLNEGLDGSDRVVLRDKIIKKLREQRGLGPGLTCNETLHRHLHEQSLVEYRRSHVFTQPRPLATQSGHGDKGSMLVYWCYIADSVKIHIKDR